MKKLKLIRGFLMTAMIAGGIMMFDGNGYAIGFAGAGNRTDDTTESSRDSGYIGAGNRSEDTTVSESEVNENIVESFISEVITVIWG
jgi:hypothetical protein